MVGAMGRRVDFWSHVEKSSGCWLWNGALGNDGYGKTTIDGQTRRAHRAAWELTNGPIPKGLLVCHHCDTPACVRPDHLFLGTPRDNTHDAVAKGRLSAGDRHWTRVEPEKNPSGEAHWTRRMPERLARGDKSGARLHPERLARGDRSGRRLHPERYGNVMGEKHHASKLTEDAVREIRELRAAGRTQQSIADVFGVSQVLIGRVLRGLNWAHVK